MTIQTRELTYESAGVTFNSTMAWDDTLGPRPGVLVAPTWAGSTDFERAQALRLAGLGYVGLDVDCLLYTSPSPRDRTRSRMPSSA